MQKYVWESLQLFDLCVRYRPVILLKHSSMQKYNLCIIELHNAFPSCFSSYAFSSNYQLIEVFFCEQAISLCLHVKLNRTYPKTKFGFEHFLYICLECMCVGHQVRRRQCAVTDEQYKIAINLVRHGKVFSLI